MENKESGKHWISGACIPYEQCYHNWETFSVGIFEWIPTKDKKGLKRGKVKVRVRGNCIDKDEVIDKAREIATLLDHGKYTGAKNVTVRGR